MYIFVKLVSLPLYWGDAGTILNFQQINRSSFLCIIIFVYYLTNNGMNFVFFLFFCRSLNTKEPREKI